MISLPRRTQHIDPNQHKNKWWCVPRINGCSFQQISKLLNILYILNSGHYRPWSQATTTIHWNCVIPLMYA